MIHATTEDARRLFLEGSQAFARIEENGIRIDTQYLERVTKETQLKIRDLESSLRNSDVYKTWRRTFGLDSNLGSKPQLAKVIFEILKFPSKGKTATGKDKSDEASYSHVDLPFVKDYFRVERLKKVVNTFLKGIRDETVDGFLHPSFNLHTARSMRSSSDSPNFQNFPVRNPESSKIIRECFVAREGRQLIEVDLVGAEVRISVCYHKDPVMMNYIEDPTTDMHRDMSLEVFLLDPAKLPEGWWKQKGSGGGHDFRHCTKNQFVFPQFYGDVYFQCAENLWESMDTQNLSIGDFRIRDHLASKGVVCLGRCDPAYSPAPGTFERHMAAVEKQFWKNRFKGYDSWKRDWYAKYRETGGFTLYTGFYIEGIYERNQVNNYPIQGSAFHCLLWTIIRLQKWLTRNKMKTVIIGQIHDSVLLDVVPSEKEAVLEKIHQLMTVDIRKHWKWVIAPLEIEIEVSPVGGSWHDKKKVT